MQAKARYLIGCFVLVCFMVWGYGSRVAAQRNNSAPNLVRASDSGRVVTFHGIRYQVFVCDLVRNRIGLHLMNDKTHQHLLTPLAVKAQLAAAGRKALMVVNAGMYKKDHDPLGLYIEEGRQHHFGLNTYGTTSTGNFYLQPNGVFYTDMHGKAHIDTTNEVSRLLKAHQLKAQIATQSGPMLVINDRINGVFTQGSANLNIRNGVGVMSDSRVVFAISLEPCNFYDFAALFRDQFGCHNALYLDGAISQMYLWNTENGPFYGNLGPMLSVSGR